MRKWVIKLWKKQGLILLTFIFCPINMEAQTSILKSLSPKTPKDSLILLTEKLLEDSVLVRADSLTRITVYRLYDSLQLYQPSLMLIEQELMFLGSTVTSRSVAMNTHKAFMLLKTGQYAEAGKLFHRNISQAHLKFDNHLITNYGGLATLMVNTAAFDSATHYISLFQYHSTQANDSAHIAEALNLQATLSFMQGKYQESLEYQRNLLPFADSSLVGNTLMEMGRNYFYQGMQDSALYFCNKSIEVKRQRNDIYGYCTSLGNLGQIYINLHDFEKALSCFDTVLTLSSKHGFTDLTAWAQRSLSDFYARQGNFEKALMFYKSYNATYEKILLQKNDVRFAIEKSKSVVANQQYRLQALQKENELSRLRTLRLTYLTIILLFLVLSIALLSVLIRLKNTKQNLELKQMLGRVRMNPHFIFNSLNALQQSILKGDIRASNKFLTTFSGLMRSTLDNSFHEMVTLENEIQHLTNYIELERMRFDNQFTYTLDVEEDINPGLLKVPPMILQPFIENAIWHGLIAKTESNGAMKISFKLKDKHLVCSISDNGIGWEESVKQKEQLNKKTEKKSLGMAITKERLEALSKIHGQRFSFTINQTKDNDRISGTCVTVTFPIIS